MARINLLPWRAELRREQRNQFATMLGITAVVAIVAAAAVWWYYDQKIDYQKQRNTYLDAEIAKLDKKIDEIKDMEQERERLVKRIEAIQNLQTVRPLEVRLFDEIVTTLPEGVFIKQIDQKGSAITIRGSAQSQSRVSNYMRNIEASKWLTNPRLEVVQTQTAPKEGERTSDFILHVDQVLPTLEAEQPKGKKGAKKPVKRGA
ncbi:MAG TPA: PilN domain-containing protein [Gammaproteobacteria bacterium]|nr:PilN domain-containing protein [Gammaproteobacteria bacterium]